MKKNTASNGNPVLNKFRDFELLYLIILSVYYYDCWTNTLSNNYSGSIFLLIKILWFQILNCQNISFNCINSFRSFKAILITMKISF